ncbi:MAG: metallophosphoesterase, partial [Oscillospiraceae bacterium]|nr:metallophosphoesterase [Oscillospiraceae bacterium]
SMGNHEFKATGQNYSDPEGATAKFLEYSGYETTDTRFELGGYQFIVFAPDRYDKSNCLFFTPEKLEWVKQELDAAVAATPDKPIFVMQHQPPYDTMKGTSGSTADKGLRALLDNYPQVIDFSGHTHCTLTDPRIIWQDTFTAINTGGMAYLSLPIMNGKNDQSGGRAIDDEGGWIGESEDSAIRNAGMYYFVEVDKNDTVRILTYNTFTRSLWGEPYIIDSLDPADFRYTDARELAAETPTFAEDAALLLRTNHYKNLQFTIPHATCKDVVQSYRVEVYQGSTLKQTFYRASNANYGEAAPQVNAYVKNLQPNTTYTIKVYATSSYNKDSAPLTMTVTTSGVNATPKADVLDVVFQADGTAVNAVNGQVLTTYGEPSVEYTYAVQGNVASFDGVDDAYGWWGISNWYDVLGTSFTLETFAYLEQKPGSSSMCLLSNLQSAGMGFSYQKDGKMYFYVRNSSSGYTYPGVAVTPGSWIHLTGTYDGSSVKFYINGVLVAEEAATGKLVVPAYMAQCMCIGSDVAVDARQSFFAGKIATAKIYSDVLSAEQVAQQYAQITGEAAAPVCPEHEDAVWTEVAPADWAAGKALTTGHYVLTGDIALSKTLTIAAGETVCIDLAGYDITASGTAAEGT